MASVMLMVSFLAGRPTAMYFITSCLSSVYIHFNDSLNKVQYSTRRCRFKTEHTGEVVTLFTVFRRYLDRILAELLAIPIEVLWTFPQALQTKAITVWDTDL
jgi:hypothetical protein